MAPGREGNIKWVDGLRGIASALVVTKHICCAWFPYLLWPAPGPDISPVLFEYPYFRVFVQGRIGVAIFSFITGYVCALKPIKLFKQGQQDVAYKSIAKSALRRIPRLVIPVAMILVLSCLATQLGAFETAKHCDGVGLPETSPTKRDNFTFAIYSLLQDQVRVWTHGISEYGSELWTMQPILKGAFWTYIFLVTTSHVQQKWRMALALLMTGYSYAANDPFFGMQFFFGAFMADLQHYENDASTSAAWLNQKSHLRSLVAAFFLIVGLFIASLPDMNWEWQAWSQAELDFLLSILPRDPDLPRFASGLGLDLIVVGLHFSTYARTILSSRPFLWLGRVSFAVYLLHNQILRSLLCWMVYGFELPEDVQDQNTGEWMPGPLLEFPGPMRLIVALPVYLVVTYGSAWLWITHVDTWCARVTERMAGSIKQWEDEKEALLPMPITSSADRS